MITYTHGNIFEVETEALVNAVNTVGVMGKGLALQFKKKYPKNFKVYQGACKKGTFKTGQVLVVDEGDLFHKKWVINFPTKAHWKNPSQYEYLETGLTALKKALADFGIKSVAIPALGCGNGGLDWDKVKAMLETALTDSDIQIQVYLPK